MTRPRWAGVRGEQDLASIRPGAMGLRPRDRVALLTARREALVALGQVQREVLALRWRAVEPSLQWAERGWQGWLFVRAHPLTVLAPVAALVVLRPRWAGRATAAFLALARLARWLR